MKRSGIYLIVVIALAMVTFYIIKPEKNTLTTVATKETKQPEETKKEIDWGALNNPHAKSSTDNIRY